MLNVETEDFSTGNRFRDRFGSLPVEAWEKVLIRSMTESVIEGAKFPRFPSAEIQNGMHGHSGEDSIREACIFYRFIKNHPDLAGCIGPDKLFLDFGCGWGRITRPFLRDFNLSNMFGYEPDIRFCTIARDLNPFACIINGGFLPDGRLPPSQFNLIVGWSIFSHLSPYSATKWLTEMSRILTVGGVCVLTTWGDRFINRLLQELERIERGEDVHWYSRHVLTHAGDIRERAKEYQDGKFVWFTDRDDGGLYGDAFVSPAALANIISENSLPFELVLFNQTDLAQDVFALRRVS
jgi:hypothetical protein